MKLKQKNNLLKGQKNKKDKGHNWHKKIKIIFWQKDETKKNNNFKGKKKN